MIPSIGDFTERQLSSESEERKAVAREVEEAKQNETVEGKRSEGQRLRPARNGHPACPLGASHIKRVQGREALLTQSRTPFQLNNSITTRPEPLKVPSPLSDIHLQDP